MTIRVTMLQTRMGDAGSYLTAGSTYTVARALGAALVGSGFATDIDGTLLAGVFKSVKAVTASRSLNADDNGATLDVSDTVALTVPAGLPTDFGCAIIPTGTITIVSGGGTLLNGATTTLSRAASTNSMFAIVHRATTADSYTVNAGLGTSSSTALTMVLPSGARDASNTTFTCAAPAVIVLKNGQFQSAIADGATAADYSLSGNNIVFAVAPTATDAIIAFI
jgi:hypothetical protein